MKDCDYSRKHGKLMCLLHDIIIYSIKTLAILTVLVILMAVLNSIWTVYVNLMEFNFILSISAFFKIFSELLIVLIAVEIFQNIAMYIKTDVIPIKLVLATALIAVARKFIIIEAGKADLYYILALSAAVIALSVSYRLIDKKIKEVN
jgi:uncharacterized membrane protein (DUF373 family)